MAPMMAMKAMKVLKAMKGDKAIKAVKKSMKRRQPMKAMKAIKVRQDKSKAAFEISVLICRGCKQAKEILQNVHGLICFNEYYCCLDKPLEVHSFVVPAA